MNKEELQQLLDKVFQGNEFKFYENLDDTNQAFDIAVDFGVVIRVIFNPAIYNMCSIKVYSMDYGFRGNPQAHERQIFGYVLPSNSDAQDLDFEFLAKILTNWRNFI